MSERYYLTTGGQRRLQGRLDRFRAEYKAVCDDNPAALESGDSSGWHDNFAFEENQRQMHRLANRIRELERVLESAEVVPPLEAPPERAFLGARVTWCFEDEDEERTVWIAGWNDGDPASGRVSYNSPLGRALLGAVPGDLRTFAVGGRERRLEILEVGPTPASERLCAAG